MPFKADATPGRRLALNDPDAAQVQRRLAELAALVDAANALLARLGSPDRIGLRVVLYPSAAEAAQAGQGPSVRVRAHHATAATGPPKGATE